jgi:hypothetical protein
MKLRQLKRAAATSLAESNGAKRRLEVLSDQAKAAKELVNAIRVRFKVTRKALRKARKHARLAALERKQAKKLFEKALQVRVKFQKRLKKTEGTEKGKGAKEKGKSELSVKKGMRPARNQKTGTVPVSQKRGGPKIKKLGRVSGHKTSNGPEQATLTLATVETRDKSA